MDTYREQLMHVLDYGLSHSAWSKKLLTRSADIVCAYGLGKYFEDAFEKFKFRENFNVNFCCDRNEERGNVVAQKYDLSFLRVDELLELNRTKKIVVILFLGEALSTFDEFKRKGVYVLDPIECLFELNCGMPDQIEWFKTNRALETYDMLEDELSRRIYVNVLAQRMALPLAEYSYAEMKSDDQYFFQKFFSLSKNEVLCDCGAFNGDSLVDFLRAVDGKFQFIYAYEMEDGNYAELQKTARKLERQYNGFNPEKYKLIHAGVWDHHDVITYGCENEGPLESYSVYKKENLKYVDDVTIDETVDIPLTFIKMDIEGAELNAIQGGADQIRHNRPKLAICVYHRLHDLWEIPMYIKSLVPEYKLFLRHHTVSLGDTVLYAVCDD